MNREIIMNNYKLYIAFIFCLISILGWAVLGQKGGINKNISLRHGYYQTIDSENFYDAKMVLSEDGTYLYNGRWGLFTMSSSGRWETKGSYLYLISFIQNLDSLDILVSEQINDSLPNVFVSIQNDKGQKLKGMVIFNQNEDMGCTWEECFFVPNEELRNLKVLYFKGTSKTYSIQNSHSNSFLITMPNVPVKISNYEPILDSLQIVDETSFIFREHIFKKQD